MDLELIIYGIFPILIAILDIFISLYLTKKRKNLFGFIISFLILVFNSLSIYILVYIILGAWPNYTPHILILVSTILLIIQYIVFKKKKMFANTL